MEEPAMTQGVMIFVYIIGGLIGLATAASLIDIRKSSAKDEKKH